MATLIEDSVLDNTIFFEIASTGLLLAIAVVNWQIYRLRRRQLSLVRDPARIWALFAVGFVFLAADELFSIHENTDHLIHWFLRMEETGLTDRIDDVIVGVYGIIGVLFVYGSREEFIGQSQSFKFIIVGFALLALMVVCDIMTNRDDLLSIIITDFHTRRPIFDALAATEDISKILGELSFLFGFFLCVYKLKGRLLDHHGGGKRRGDVTGHSSEPTPHPGQLLG